MRITIVDLLILFSTITLAIWLSRIGNAQFGILGRVLGFLAGAAIIPSLLWLFWKFDRPPRPPSE